MQAIRLALVLTSSLVALAGCPKADAGPPSPEQSAPVENVVRSLYSGYIGAGSGDQARAALEASGTAAFISQLKAKAAACSSAPSATCDVDPIVCSAGSAAKIQLTAVVVNSVDAKSATAAAVLTLEGGKTANPRVTLSSTDGAWKVEAVVCP